MFFIRIFFIGFIWVASSWEGAAQFVEIWVSDSAGVPLQGAHIQCFRAPGASSYAITDAQGRALCVCHQPCRVEVRHIGFKLFSGEVSESPFKIQLQKDHRVLSPVIIQSEFLEKEAQESPRRIDVITRARIQQQGAQNLSDVLGNEMNIRISRDNILGSGASIMGTGSENVQILLDGMPVTGRLDGTLDLGQFLLNDVERIEVVKGPVSTLYGSNALGGVINIIRRKPDYGALTLRTDNYYESVGQYNFSGLAMADFRKWRIKGHGGRYFFDGFAPDSGLNKRWQQWRPKRQAFGGLHLEYAGRKLQVGLEAALFSEKLQNNGRVLPPFFINAFDEWIFTHRLHAGVHVNWTPGSRHKVQSVTSFNGFDRLRNKYFKDLVRLEDNLVEQMRDQFGLIMQRSWYAYNAASGVLSVLSGWDIRHEWATGNKLNPSRPNQTDAAGFVTWDLRPVAWFNLNTGMRMSWNSAFRTTPAPTAAFLFKPMEFLSLRFSYARGFRAPDLKELFFEFVDINHNIRGNPNLRPETSHHLTAGIDLRRNTEKYAFSAGWMAFANQIDNRITMTALPGLQVPPVYTFRNLSGFRSAGTVLNLSFQWKNVRLEPGYGLTWFSSRQTPSQPYTQPLAMQEWRANATYYWKKAGCTFSVFYKYNGPQQVFVANNDSSMGLSRLEGFHQVDVSVLKSFFRQMLTLGVFVKNLTDVRNVAFSLANPGAHQSGSGQTPALWGRTVAVSASFQLQKSLNKKGFKQQL
ncbi:MAG: TonB-dependent receptor [Flavobacteriales bacterium]|nr:TonB-dependent receptor [Flavobacteriales bacterium]